MIRDNKHAKEEEKWSRVCDDVDNMTNEQVLDRLKQYLPITYDALLEPLREVLKDAIYETID